MTYPELANAIIQISDEMETIKTALAQTQNELIGTLNEFMGASLEQEKSDWSNHANHVLLVESCYLCKACGVINGN